MPFWTMYGLNRGLATTAWPGKEDAELQAGVLGLPDFHPERCREDCHACMDACLPTAITAAPGEQGGVTIDYGRCISCQLCAEVCPEGVFTKSNHWAFGVRNREDLRWTEALSSKPAEELKEDIQRCFGHSLHIRHVDAGSDGGCESELQALNNPYYNLHRLGIFFTPSPRFADLLLVTGSVTYAMREPLLETYNAMPEPRWVMAVGTSAISGGVTGSGYSCGHGVDDILPVDIYLPGSPPNPAAIIHALLLLLNRTTQHVHGGHYVE